MVGDKRHCLRKLINLLLSAASNVLNTPVPLLWLDP